MGVYAGPEITSDGLVLALDAGNSKGFDDDENLALNSEAINSWPNNGNAISISANSQIAPDGTLTADVLSQTAVTGASRWVSSMTRTYTAGVTYTLSIWLKKISGTDAQPTINLWVNGGTTQSVGAITTEWVRYSKSFTPASTISSSTFTGLNIGWSDTGVANNFTFAAWGFQVETSSSASPYYPTTGTAKNRGSTLIDLTGRGNTGTLTNGPTYSSANGGSIVFDGTNDYVTSPFTFTAGQAVTILGWLYSTASTSAYRNFVDTSSNRPMIWWNTSGQIEFDTGSGYTTPAVYRNQWVYVGLVKPSGSTIASYYVNGVFASNGGVSYSVPASTPTWFNRGGSQTWIGNCSNASIYNRALTAAEIQQNFNALRGRFGI